MDCRIPDLGVRDGDHRIAGGDKFHGSHPHRPNLSIVIADLDPVSYAERLLTHDHQSGDQTTDVVLEGKTNGHACGPEHGEQVSGSRPDQERDGFEHCDENDDQPQHWNPGQNVETVAFG